MKNNRCILTIQYYKLVPLLFNGVTSDTAIRSAACTSVVLVGCCTVTALLQLPVVLLQLSLI
jgi:hypothetical protein